MDYSDFSAGAIWAIDAGTLSGMLDRLPMSTRPGTDSSGPKSQSAVVKKSGKVAVIPIAGPLSRRETFLSFLFGGSSMLHIGQLLGKAVADPEVDAILLDIDSPGGTIAGTAELASQVLAARDVKPVIAYTDGSMCSAAYWIGSAAGAVVASKSACLGSIGCVIVHSDCSEADTKAGVRNTVIASGKYKAVGHPHSALSDEDRKIIQDRLDHMHGVFITAVADHLGVAVAVVRSKMADGSVFIGQQAVDIGMATQCGNFTDALHMAVEMATTRDIPPIEKAKHSIPGSENRYSALAGESPETIAGIIELTYGADIAERFRNFSAAGGRPEVFFSMRDLWEKPQASGIVDKDKILAGLRRDESPSHYPGQFLELVSQYQKAHNCGKADAIEAVMLRNPADHEAYIRWANGLN